MRNNKLKFKKAFTLIETLVAITILSAAVAGPMVLSIKNIGTASVSQDQLVAFYLGQEVIEYVRNVRDTNILKESADWLDGLESCKTNGCYIDVAVGSICKVDECLYKKLKFDVDNKLYSYSQSNEGFTRTVKIENPVNGNDDEAKVSVSMEWTGKYGEKTMNLQDNIFNWR